MQGVFLALRAAVAAVLFVGLWTWLGQWVRRFDPAIGVVVPERVRPAGWILVVLGAGLTLACVTVFATRGQGTPAPFDPPRQFVASGPYRYVRNPMYWGAFWVIVGAGLVLRSPAILLLALAFWLFFHVFVLVYEEPALMSKFGESYERYRREVRRWLPRRSR
jgi:protein-S-isoprenylcysteine O-methyltransferase Ste14